MDELSEAIRIRLSTTDKKLFERAAKRSRMPLSMWCRQAMAAWAEYQGVLEAAKVAQKKDRKK